MSHTSSEETWAHDTHTARIGVAGIQSLHQVNIGERGLSRQPGWLGMLLPALAELPRGYQGEQANTVLERALVRIGAHFQREVRAGLGSGHSVDFVIEFNNDRIGVELGTGQGERVELDLLKLISLVLRREINCGCLILPQNVTRHSIFGTQKMPTAVNGLARLCAPILTLIQAQLEDVVVIWYA